MWMRLHAVKAADGTIRLPARIPHPGKRWIEEQAELLGKHEEKKEDVKFAVPQDPKVKTLEAVPAQSDDNVFKVIWRDGGFRLLQVNFLGKRVADVALPASTKLWQTISMDGKVYLKNGNDDEGDIYLCSEFIEAMMPKKPGGLMIDGYLNNII